MTDKTNDSIIEKIRALLRKVGDAASSEAEVEAAMKAAERLMTKHDLSIEDVRDVRDTGVKKGVSGRGSKPHDVFEFCGYAVSVYTETKTYYDSQETGHLAFIGTPADVEMALYLVALIEASANRGWLACIKGRKMSRTEYTGERRGYLYGFGTKMHERLMQMYEARKAQRTMGPTGTELVIVKTDLIKQWLEDNDLRLRKGRAKRAPINTKSVSRGMSDADKVNLGRPFAGSARHGEIGK